MSDGARKWNNEKTTFGSRKGNGRSTNVSRQSIGHLLHDFYLQHISRKFNGICNLQQLLFVFIALTVTLQAYIYIPRCSVYLPVITQASEPGLRPWVQWKFLDRFSVMSLSSLSRTFCPQLQRVKVSPPNAWIIYFPLSPISRCSDFNWAIRRHPEYHGLPSFIRVRNPC